MRSRAAEWLRSRRLPAAALVTALGSAIGDWVWLTLLAALVCTACALPGPTFVRRQVTALPVFVGLSATAFTVLAVAHVRTDPRWVVLAIAVACFAALVRSTAPVARWADAIDGWSAAAAVVSVALVARSAVTWHAAQILARLARHTDGIRHIALGAAVERHGGYVTFAPDPHALPGFQHYPQGGAGLMAIVLRAAGGLHPDIQTTVVVGFWTLVASLGFMAWVFNTLALTLADRMGTLDRRPFGYAVVAFVAVTTVAVGPHFMVFEPGYFTQELAAVSLFVFLILLVDPSLRTRAALVPALVLVAIAQTWYLLLPVPVAAGAWWWWRQPSRRSAIAPLISATPFILFPLVTGPSPTKQLLAVGATPTPNRFVVAAALVGGAAAVVALRSRTSGSARVHGSFAVAFAALVVLTVLVGSAEIVVASADSAYYAIKLFVLLLIFASLAMAVALLATLGSRDERDKVFAAAMGLATIGVVAAGWPYFVEKTATPSPGNVREAQLYFAGHPTATSPSQLHVVYDGCGRRDRFLTHAAATLGHEFAPSRLHDMTLFMNSYGSPPRGLAHLSRDPGVSRLTVITARPCAPRDLEQLARLPHVVVVGAPAPSP